jgi:Transcriptional regulatory protein, C terminal
MLVRHFRGVILDGAEDRLMGMLNDDLLPRLKAHPAVLATTLSVPLEVGRPREFLMETHWRSVRDLIRFAGDNWRTPRVEGAEEECLASVSAHHYVTMEFAPGSMAGAPPPPTTMLLDDVEIDGTSLLVTWDGLAIHLPPREMAAMLALAARPGDLLASVELARLIWPGSALVGPYDVRRVIHRLRTLLRSSGAPLEIRNLHGKGYGLELPARR